MTAYYVNKASSGGDGTTIALTGDQAAFATIANVNAATFSAGDTVSFNRGDIHTQTTALTCDQAGGVGTPVIYNAYGTGANPLFDGDGTSANCISISVSNVTIKDIDIKDALQRNLYITTGVRDNIILEGITCSGGLDGIYSLGQFTAFTMTDCTIVHGQTGATEYGLLLQPGDLTGTATITNLSMSSDGTNAIERPIYFRETGAAVCTIVIDGLTCTNVLTSVATSGLITIRTSASTLTDVTIDSTSVGNISIGDGAETPIVTFDNLNFIDSTAFGINLGGASGQLTVLNSSITNCDRDGIIATAFTSVIVRDSVISNNGTGTLGSGVKGNTSGTITVTSSTLNYNSQDGVHAGEAVNTVLTGIHCDYNETDGINISGTGTHDIIGCVADYNGTAVGSEFSGDGISGHNTCVLHIIGCSTAGNLGGGFSHVNDCSGYMYNCTAWGNYLRSGSDITNNVAGLRLQTLSAFEVKDCIFVDNDFGMYIDAATVLGATLTFAGNLYYSSGLKTNQMYWNDANVTYEEWVSATSETGSLNEDPDFVDLIDFELQLSSPCVGTASKWWTGANPTGTNGEPFSDFDTDKGANQSTHSPFHPVNL